MLSRRGLAVAGGRPAVGLLLLRLLLLLLLLRRRWRLQRRLLAIQLRLVGLGDTL